MLAYVFWHVPRQGTPAPSYELALVGFHAALSSGGIEGLVGSVSYAVAGARWVAEGDAYEDWYLIDGFAALGRLNEAVVAPGSLLSAEHQRAATLCDAGTAGVYALRRGETMPLLGECHWYGRAPTAAGDHARLWQRQLVLGPTPEWCVEGGHPELSEEPVVVTRRRRVAGGR